MIITQVIVNHNKNSQPHKKSSQVTATHIVVQYIVATHKSTLRTYSKFIATHIIVKWYIPN